MAKEGKKPKSKVRVGCMTVTTWENETDKGTFLSHNIQRSYKDAKGEWQNTESFKTADIPKLLLALQKTYEAAVIKDEE